MTNLSHEVPDKINKITKPIVVQTFDARVGELCRRVVKDDLALLDEQEVP